jgi:glycerol-3-phosphate dehydrogenase (NAD(P)+)
MENGKIAVIGAGSWGTTLSQLLAEQGLSVTLWVFEEDLLQALTKSRCNTMYLPGIVLHDAIAFTRSLAEAVADKDIILWVSPSQVFRSLLTEALPFAQKEALHVCASKGIENGSLKRLSEIAEETDPALKDQRFVALSGPSFAREVCAKLPTAVVVASRDAGSALRIQKVMATPWFRTYTSQDVVGVELGGALKNVIALAAGVADGLGYGYNTRAALITRGLAEMIRLGNVQGADALTFSGLSGLGDLVLTCTSMLSRNYGIGLQLGQGKALEDILSGMNAVAEGILTARSAYFLARKHQVEMPITSQVYQILYEQKPAAAAVKDLMGRQLKHETPA